MHFFILTIGEQENVTYIADIRINVITNHAVGKTQKYNDGGLQYDEPLITRAIFHLVLLA